MLEIEEEVISFLAIKEAASYTGLEVDEFTKLHKTELYFDESKTSNQIFTKKSLVYYLSGKISPKKLSDEKSRQIQRLEHQTRTPRRSVAEGRFTDVAS